MRFVGIRMGMHEPIGDHLAAIDTGRDLPRLLGAAAGPDRTHPVAREWVRRWQPARALTALPDCGCAVGRCAVCN